MEPGKRKNSDPSICATCHVQGRGCCRLSDPTGTDQMFGLTLGEIKAMAQAGGLEPGRFLVADTTTDQFYKFLGRINPIFHKILYEGRRYRLQVDEQGVCTFLGPDGCKLPTGARPIYCRLYPFMFTEDHRLMVLVSPRCLAQEKARNWREVLRRMDMKEDNLRRLFARLEELALEHERLGGRLGPLD